MSSHLPEYVDPLSLAEKGCLIKGEYPLESLPRLKGMLASYGGNVIFELKFEKEGRMRVVTGSVSANLGLDCQVCMEKIDLPVDRKVSLSIVTSIEQAERLPEAYEPLLLQDMEEAIVLMDIVEDELLLALPDVAKHGNCTHKMKSNTDIIEEVESDKPVNPFSILENLKKD